MFDIHHHAHHSTCACAPLLGEILSRLKALASQGESFMATLQQILDEVKAESTAVDSLIKLTDGLKQQLTDALAQGQLDQTKIDEIFGEVNAEKQKVVDALAANVPPAPAPAPAP